MGFQSCFYLRSSLKSYCGYSSHEGKVLSDRACSYIWCRLEMWDS